MSELSDLVKKYKKRIEESAKFANTTIADKVVTRTPVFSGDLRASWTPSLNEAVAENVNVSQGETERHSAPEVINKMKAGDTFYLSNGQPYAMRIEYEGQEDWQAPNGMLRVSVAEWGEIVKEAAKRAKLGN